MITRQQYMAPYISKEDATARHRAYYAQFVNDRVKNTVLRSIRKNEILASYTRDPNNSFNDIQLIRWDRLHKLDGVDHALLKEAGEGWSLSVTVCIAKEAARQIAETKETDQ